MINSRNRILIDKLKTCDLVKNFLAYFNSCFDQIIPLCLLTSGLFGIQFNYFNNYFLFEKHLLQSVPSIQVFRIKLNVPSVCIVIVWCTEITFIAITKLEWTFKRLYRVIKKSLCTWWLQHTSFLPHNLAQSDCLAADLQGQRDTKHILTPSVIPNSKYVIMVSDWNCLKYFCVFFVL
jgi:hypothetical protein